MNLSKMTISFDYINAENPNGKYGQKLAAKLLTKIEEIPSIQKICELGSEITPDLSKKLGQKDFDLVSLFNYALSWLFQIFGVSFYESDGSTFESIRGQPVRILRSGAIPMEKCDLFSQEKV